MKSVKKSLSKRTEVKGSAQITSYFHVVKKTNAELLPTSGIVLTNRQKESKVCLSSPMELKNAFATGHPSSSSTAAETSTKEAKRKIIELISLISNPNSPVPEMGASQSKNNNSDMDLKDEIKANQKHDYWSRIHEGINSTIGLVIPSLGRATGLMDPSNEGRTADSPIVGTKRRKCFDNDGNSTKKPRQSSSSSSSSFLTPSHRQSLSDIYSSGLHSSQPIVIEVEDDSLHSFCNFTTSERIVSNNNNSNSNSRVGSRRNSRNGLNSGENSVNNSFDRLNTSNSSGDSYDNNSNGNGGYKRRGSRSRTGTPDNEVRDSLLDLVFASAAGNFSVSSTATAPRTTTTNTNSTAHTATTPRAKHSISAPVTPNSNSSSSKNSNNSNSSTKNGRVHTPTSGASLTPKVGVKITSPAVSAVRIPQPTTSSRPTQQASEPSLFRSGIKAKPSRPVQPKSSATKVSNTSTLTQSSSASNMSVSSSSGVSGLQNNNKVLGDLSVSLHEAQAILEGALLCYTSQTIVDRTQEATDTDYDGDGDGTMSAVRPAVAEEFDNSKPTSSVVSGSNVDTIRASHAMNFLISSLWKNTMMYAESDSDEDDDEEDEDFNPEWKQIRALYSEMIHNCSLIHTKFSGIPFSVPGTMFKRVFRLSQEAIQKNMSVDTIRIYSTLCSVRVQHFSDLKFSTRLNAMMMPEEGKQEEENEYNKIDKSPLFGEVSPETLGSWSLFVELLQRTAANHLFPPDQQSSLCSPKSKSDITEEVVSVLKSWCELADICHDALRPANAAADTTGGAVPSTAAKATAQPVDLMSLFKQLLSLWVLCSATRATDTKCNDSEMFAYYLSQLVSLVHNWIVTDASSEEESEDTSGLIRRVVRNVIHTVCGKTSESLWSILRQQLLVESVDVEVRNSGKKERTAGKSSDKFDVSDVCALNQQSSGSSNKVVHYPLTTTLRLLSGLVTNVGYQSDDQRNVLSLLLPLTAIEECLTLTATKMNAVVDMATATAEQTELTAVVSKTVSLLCQYVECIDKWFLNPHPDLVIGTKKGLIKSDLQLSSEPELLRKIGLFLKRVRPGSE